MFLFLQNRTATISGILFGVGGIFYALNPFISAGMSPLKDLLQFKEIWSLWDKPHFRSGGRCSDYCPNSGLATIGILQGLMQVASSTLKVHYQSLRGYIGTTLTVIITQLSHVSAKRVAKPTLPLTFRDYSCLILLGPFTAMIEYFQALLHLTWGWPSSLSRCLLTGNTIVLLHSSEPWPTLN